jgi:hypothetical protein
LVTSAAQLLPHLDAVGELLEGVRLHRPQGEPGLQVPRVELEELARHPLPDLDDVGRLVEALPDEFGVGDEADAGEERVRGALVECHEDSERFDRRDGAGQRSAGGQRCEEGPQLRVLGYSVHAPGFHQSPNYQSGTTGQ